MLELIVSNRAAMTSVTSTSGEAEVVDVEVSDQEGDREAVAGLDTSGFPSTDSLRGMLSSISLDASRSVSQSSQRVASDASLAVENVVEAILGSLEELEMLVGVAASEFKEERATLIPFFSSISENLQHQYRSVDAISDRIKSLHGVVEHMEQELLRVEASSKSNQVDISKTFADLTEKGVTQLKSVKDQVNQNENVQKMKELGKKNLTEIKSKGTRFFQMLKAKSTTLVKPKDAGPASGSE